MKTPKVVSINKNILPSSTEAVTYNSNSNITDPIKEGGAARLRGAVGERSKKAVEFFLSGVPLTDIKEELRQVEFNPSFLDKADKNFSLTQNPLFELKKEFLDVKKNTNTSFTKNPKLHSPIISKKTNIAIADKTLSTDPITEIDERTENLLQNSEIKKNIKLNTKIKIRK